MSSHSGSDQPHGDSKLTGTTVEDYDDGVSEDFSNSDGDFDGTSVHTAKSVKQEEYHGSKRDTKHVWVSMIVVLIMIGATTAVVLAFTNKFLLDEETAEFENGFRQHVSAVAEGTTFHAKAVVTNMESMAETITSYSAASRAQWPLVTVPDFVRRGQRTIEEARFDMIAFSPIVDAKHVSNWSSFVANESVGSIYEDGASQSSGFPNTNIYQHRNGDIFYDESSYVPFWMSSPKPYNISVVNLDLLSKETYSKAFQNMQTSEQTVLSELYTASINEDMVFLKDNIFPPDYFDGKLVANNFGIPLNTNGNKQKENAGEAIDQIPHSILMTPVFDSFRLDERSLVGVVYAIMPWDKFFTELLPDDVNGIIGVLRDTCGNRHSFVINGKEAAYIGEGDVAGTNNAYISQNIDFGNIFAAEGTECVYSLSIYPSENFEALFYSDAHKFFMPFFAGVFGCLAIGFLLFFWFVERRQRRVVGIAQRTTAIVSSLFPDNVRARIMQQAEEQANEEAKGNVIVVGEDGANQNLAQLLDSGKKQEAPGTPKSSGSSRRSLGSRTPRYGGKRKNPNEGTVGAPIADRYPNCTVFFADIVGFTSWSAERDPAEVFTLLETLYGAADHIAKRLGVFKVETIGDCYVAVTGLPNPRVDHAVVLARFANRFLLKSREVFHSLEESLGTGTRNLDVRIGLHSGPVTAGVLRGEKARFQLFGDTVNTAARMESNSRTGKIHCSKDTADLLVEGGKESWLTERPDTIVAKGKGEMITYFIDVPTTDASSKRSGYSKRSFGSKKSLSSKKSADSDSSGHQDFLSPETTPDKIGSRRGIGPDPGLNAIPRAPSLD